MATKEYHIQKLKKESMKETKRSLFVLFELLIINKIYNMKQYAELNDRYFIEGKIYFEKNLKYFQGKRKIKKIHDCAEDCFGNPAHKLIELEGKKEPNLVHEKFLNIYSSI